MSLFDISIWWRIVILIIGLVLGFLFILKPLQIVSIIGKMPWAEEKMGPGGTYSAVQLFGIFIIIVAVVITIH